MDGFSILLGWLVIGSIFAWYHMTTPAERRSLGHTMMGLMLIGLALVTALELVQFVSARLP